MYSEYYTCHIMLAPLSHSLALTPSAELSHHTTSPHLYRAFEPMPGTLPIYSLLTARPFAFTFAASVNPLRISLPNVYTMMAGKTIHAPLYGQVSHLLIYGRKSEKK